MKTYEQIPKITGVHKKQVSVEIQAGNMANMMVLNRDVRMEQNGMIINNSVLLKTETPLLSALTLVLLELMAPYQAE